MDLDRGRRLSRDGPDGQEEKTLAGGARLRGGQPSGILARPITACMTFLRLQRFLIGPGLFVELACCSQLMKRGSRETIGLQLPTLQFCCSLRGLFPLLPTLENKGCAAVSRQLAARSTKLPGQAGWRAAEFTCLRLCSPDSPRSSSLLQLALCRMQQCSGP